VTPVPVWIVGAGGMLAGEFLRLALAHPELALGGAITRQSSVPLADLHPHLPVADRTQTLEEALPALGDAPEGAWLVLALPHGESAAAWRSLRATLGEGAERLRIVDLSADYRLQDSAAYERWYGKPHADRAELQHFAYGLPELTDALSGATRIAAPGCFATALQLACVPAARAGLVTEDAPWVVHAVTGSSGSGAKPKAGTHHPHRNANLHGYAPDGHRHEAELAQALEPAGLAPRVTFLPHSGPFVRGIHLSAVLPLAANSAGTTHATYDEAHEAYITCYAECPFVEVLGEGAPELRRVVGSNRAVLGVNLRNDALVVSVAIDNLVKGGSGQALQAMNLAAGWPETLGLPRNGLGAI